ncbi:non-hydrolyzing UDP-N-acetylglucosamine 2-epimerase [Schinkia azotoformans]|uniref:non-hydrolyzing UDP-N-acetylglucosamine 2-epimerase n=1 Tax=Schinkia azotoformans TaxID=1454 RepID=UPI002DB6BDA0|nr:UDP-N-acetylglucosamine 2-epimerase (non-hydrolyzing) [Schinkia azotoformans]MEC1741729.1 UDP-N-acetylglucosamine 2-epimerase (non-hydrolyzing) [Schinkia azotoformans]MEC1766593.1 UDP-N-acetylglucosamine 2-epimerase (non-hydrolyzing) [Schinkia azotoformans]MEC1788008.1 UDP-N-acetylglucosamine 2-epimerase (non-hydrolyzing) [Schinkia azotoformans]MED4375426.1 UDP-N-acetylglucosamine 2-epimerase (non-hydrolyzing) [Schinkia azotoformans]MED4419436.1 UDP-N-acetylglucosamine 2-epimerase (non-hydr
MKIITIIGARPQFIKAAPFSEVFRKKNEEILVHTGQHYDANMSDIFFEELGIPKPDYHLGVGSGGHGMQTGRMLEKIEEIIVKENPDGLLVYGDTNSTLAGALAASKLHIPVFHVEAGLRSYNKRMPEEQNRVLTDHLSDLLLCPTDTAVHNLEKEGVTAGVIQTGDIMYDVVVRNIEISKSRYANGAWLEELRKENSNFPALKEKDFYLATIHRAENTDDPNKLRSIFAAFEKMDKPVLLPLHPRTRRLIEDYDIEINNTIIINPVGYLLMLYLTAHAYMVVTDSGGLQKEAYFLKTPCTTLRDQTEWVETLENGWNVLSPIEVDRILKLVTRELTCLLHPQPPLFGDGHAAEKINQAILDFNK